MQWKVIRYASVCVYGVAAVCGILLAGSPAVAQTPYYWTTSPSSIVGGSGAWDSSTPNWTENYPGGGGNVAWTSSANADFSGTGGTVAVSGSQTVGNIIFDGAGYTLDASTSGAGTLILGGATPTITTNAASATINSLLTGANGLTIAGNGTLTLTNTTNNYTGGTTVNSGTLTLNPFNNYNTYGYGIIKGPLTINAGAMVFIENYWSLGYIPGQCVSSININNGVLNNGSKGMGPQTITMSGGTISGTTTWYTFDTPAALNTIGGGTLALISAAMSINVSNLTFNVAQGSVPGGIDLLDSGAITPYYNNTAYSITKTGAGLLCMSGNSAYAGTNHITTYVNAGVLAVTGTLDGSGNVYVSGSSAAEPRHAQRHGRRRQRLRPGQRGPGARRLLHRRGDL